MRRRGKLRPWLLFALLAGALAYLALSETRLRALLRLLFPLETELLYPRAGLPRLLAEHLAVVGLSSLLAALTGLGLGILATRPKMESLRALIDRLVAVGQTFPPAAVLALSVPLLGFGFAPAVAALYLYGLLPVLRNTVSGLEGVPAASLDAARGLGMGPLRSLLRVELPLAFPVVLAGLRGSVVVNMGTAAVGAAIGAGGLGAPIISGLVTWHPAYLAEGGIAVVLLALALDSLFSALAPPDRT